MSESRKQVTADIDALIMALKPIAEICLKSGNGAGDLVFAAKLACIAAAAPNAKIGGRLNHSRISATTGLTRKEIRTLSQSSSAVAHSTVRQYAGQRNSRVIYGWRTDPQFQNDKGAPASLTIRGDNASFPALVRRYGGDVTPISVLKELHRNGVVSRIGENRIRLLKTHLRSPGFSRDALFAFGEQIGSLGGSLIAAIQNPTSSPYVAYESMSDLSPDEAALFHSIFSERSAALIDGVKRWYGSQVRLKSKTKQSKQAVPESVGIGVYMVSRMRANK